MIKKRSFNQWSLRYKMLAITLLTTLSSLLIVYVALIGIELFNSWAQAVQQLSISGKTVGRNVRSSLVFDDKRFATQALEAFSIQDNILNAALYREDGSLFAEYYRNKSLDIPLLAPEHKEGTSLEGKHLVFVEKLYLDGDLVGTINVRSDLSQYFNLILRDALLLSLVLLVSTGLAYRVWAKLQPYVTQPIFQLLEIMNQVSDQHDYSIRVPKQGDDELGQLINSFNEMLSQIQERDRLLEAHSKQLESRVIERTHDLMQEKLNAEAANRSKSEFLATMSHEIRTPMNAILGFSYLTLRTNLSAKQKENLTNIHVSAQSLLNILNDILDFSKIDVGKMELDLVPFDLRKIISHVNNVMKVSAQQKGLNFSVNQNQGLPQYVVGDSNRLQQVLINLVGNAIKFTNDGEVKVTIHAINVDPSHAELTFSISDTGIGISKEQQESLFQLFTQVDASITRQFGGTGLGLAISQKLVNLMGGEIYVDSVENQGTTFYFSLIFELAEQKQLSSNNNNPHELEVPTHLMGSIVMLVEDQYINQQVAIAILEQAGIDVYIANNGQEAVDMVNHKETDFDAILMDLQMPEMSGYEASRIIRNSVSGHAIPIIAMTANILAGESNQLSNSGMNDYVPKPIIPTHLYNTLSKWIKPKSNPEAYEKTTLEKDRSNSDSDDILPKVLPGVNIKVGLDRIYGDRHLYRRLLFDFLRNKKETSKEFKKAFEEKNMELCREISHTIKGLAGNLGAERLFIQAQSMERELKNEQFNQELLESFTDAFDEVTEGLQDLEKSSQSLMKEMDSVRQYSPELEQQLKKMQNLLHSGDFEAVSCLQNIEQLLTGNHTKIYEQLEAQAMSFNFNAALDTLNKLQTIIKKQNQLTESGRE